MIKYDNAFVALNSSFDWGLFSLIPITLQKIVGHRFFQTFNMGYNPRLVFDNFSFKSVAPPYVELHLPCLKPWMICSTDFSDHDYC